MDLLEVSLVHLSNNYWNYSCWWLYFEWVEHFNNLNMAFQKHFILSLIVVKFYLLHSLIFRNLFFTDKSYCFSSQFLLSSVRLAHLLWLERFVLRSNDEITFWFHLLIYSRCWFNIIDFSTAFSLQRCYFNWASRIWPSLRRLWISIVKSLFSVYFLPKC